ncbi:glycoside hydrolase family 2 protein [Lacticaseibacillus nasuensis]|uniref:glycoside hydrolase family 2 protein n=1 Tax=Lacticaseibacillus nasuensis TaxID=944671 RepID=UPI000704B961|nr:sugar-binding domain-containing protein [Lacticaseibacillus nasuensis]
MTTIPRPEFPEPQFQRDHWQNLNGQWDFLIDDGDSGLDRHFETTGDFDQQITVPFCPESELSGIHHLDFMPAVWYRRTVTVSAAELAGVVRLHFGAVDYETHVFVNGEAVGTHRGGYSSFAFDIQAHLHEGANTLVVCARDDLRSGKQPNGKQSHLYYSHDCDYTRTTGIWQTVWLEFLPQTHVQSVKFFPNVARTSVAVQLQTVGAGDVTIAISYQGQPCGQATVASTGQLATVEIPLSEQHLWELGHGRLYDVTLTIGDDVVHSYFGLREVRLEGYKFMLNDRSVFQRLVLDQGFYPTGIYTAPSDADFVRDIELAKAAGFNGARLHQKPVEARYLYHCDQAGYMVWGEMASWGIDGSRPEAIYHFLPEWQELVARDINHPAIVTWCPFNETWDVDGRPQLKEIWATTYHVTKATDPTRPCVDTSGNYHAVTDIYDIHNYEQDPAKFAEEFDGAQQPNHEFWDEHDARQQYQAGQPINVSEYGGIKWAPSEETAGWGYGDGPKTEAEFMARYAGLTKVLLANPHLSGFCYTQLYDVEQERNGLYYYDRSAKFDMGEIKAATEAKAAIED